MSDAATKTNDSVSVLSKRTINTYFHAKGSVLLDFIEKTKCWISDAGHTNVHSNGKDDEHPADNLSVASDDINPEDSVSNVSCQEHH